MRPLSPGSQAVLLCLALGCQPTGSGDSPDGENGSSGSSSTEGSTQTGTDAVVTWHADVRPLIDEHCASCHAPGLVAPFTFEDWEEVSILAPAIVSAVETGSMPPHVVEQRLPSHRQ